MHIGERTSSSPAQAVYAQAANVWSTANTVAWYTFSGFFFGEIYIWTRSDEAELRMVDPGSTYVRARLNENPIYMRFMFLVLAVMQAILHLARDYDRLDTLSKKEGQGEAGLVARMIGPATMEKLPRSLRLLVDASGGIVAKSVNLTVAGPIMAASPLYWVFGFRYTAWNWVYFFAKPLNHSLPSYEPPTGIQHVASFAWQCFTASFMLISLLEASNTLFTTFVAQAPLRKSQPLTSEIRDMRGVILHKSKDPNGSLLTGLKSKKEVVKSFAFWELDLICEQFDTRRKTMYTEVDRENGSTWSQICKLCIEEINQVDQRISASNLPANYQKKLDEEALRRQQQKDMMAAGTQEQVGLRKIANQGVIDNADVFAKQRPDFYSTVGSMAKSIGQQPGAQNPIAPRARKAIEWSADQLLSREDQQRLRPSHLEQRASGYMAQLLRTPFGDPFRQTFARKAASILFGTPTSSRANLIHATRAVAKLITSSLTEDTYGQVQKDIKPVVLALTNVIKGIEKFVQESNPHWSDVEFNNTRSRRIVEVESVLEVLKTALREILLAFEEYANALELTRKEVREAKEAMVVVEKLGGSAEKARIEGGSAGSGGKQPQQQIERPEMKQVR